MVGNVKIEYVDLNFPGCLVQLSKFLTSNINDSEISCLFHEHSYYEFHFSPYACYDIVTQEKTFTLETNTLFIIPPHLSHYSTCTRANNSIILNVDLKMLEGDSPFYDYFKKSIDSNCLKKIKIADDIKKCFYSFNNISANGTIKNHCVLKLSALNILTSLLTDDGSITHKSKKEQIDILLENYVNSPTYSISQIAENLNYSQRQTARLIHEKYNMSLGDIRKLQTLCTFKKLIDDGYSIKDAMALSDIKSPETFRNFFKKHEGMTPKEYRDMRQKK